MCESKCVICCNSCDRKEAVHCSASYFALARIDTLSGYYYKEVLF